MRSSFVRAAAVLAITALSSGAPELIHAQALSGITLIPFAGYVVTGSFYDGPLSTSIGSTNAAVVGAQVGVPLMKGVSLTGSVGHASGDLEIGLPIIGGIDVGSTKMWLYDAGVEIGGIRAKGSGVAPFVLGGIGGITNDVSSAGISTHSTNLAYTAGVGVDIGAAHGFALRVQAKDYMGHFDTREAVGFKVDTKLAHNWALSAGVKFAF